MSKRANNEGSIYFDNVKHRWVYKYTAPDGKRRIKTAPTQAEAKKLATEIQSTIQAGIYTEPTKMTVADWLSTWMEEYHKKAVRPSTFATDSHIIDAYLIPAFKRIKLQALQTHQIQAFINGLDLAPATIQRIAAVLKGAIKQACENSLILRNPCTPVKLPKHTQKEIKYFTKEERDALLPALPNSEYGRMIQFMFFSGLRISEACGLRWEDVRKDFSGIDVRNAIDSLGNDAAPKSEAGKRFIPLLPQAAAILSAQRSAQLTSMMKYGIRSDEYVFTTAAGGCCDRHNAGRALRTACKKAGIPSRGLHAIRHTFATVAIQTGIIDYKTLSSVIGHSKVSFTIQTYGHSDEEAKKNLLRTIEQAL